MITFENSPVQIGDFYVLANSASISISDPRRGTKSFGEPGFDSQVREGAAVGSVNVSYYMTSGDENVRNLFTGNGIQLFDISVGPYRCYSGVANSMSMTIEPYSVVSCTLDMSFYNGYDQDGSTGNIATPEDLIHGGASEAYADVLWGTDLVSVNYSMAQSISPVYSLGELMPGGYTREGGTIEVGLAGTGWGHIVDTSTLCEGYTTGNISLDRLCEACITGEREPSIQHPAADWEQIYPPGGIYEGIWASIAPCPGCWGTGDSVTITWPGAAGEPWSLGVSAEIYDMSIGSDDCDIGYRWAGEIAGPPEAYEITVSNNVLGGPPPPFIIPFSGYVVNPDITVDPNGELNGSLTVFGNLLKP